MKLCWCIEGVVFVVGLALIIIHVASKVWYVVKTTNLRSCISFAERLRQAVLSFLKQRQEAGQLDPHVQAMIKHKRMEFATMKYLGGANLAAFSVATILWNYAWDRPRWMDPLQQGVVLSLLAVLDFASLRPFSGETFLEVNYGLCMLLMSGFMWFSEAEDVTTSLWSSIFARGLFSLPHIKMKSIVAWNLVAMCVSLGSIAKNTPGSGAGQMYIMEVSLTGVLILCGLEFRKWVVRTIRRELAISDLEVASSASLSLLDMVCDVVVKLSSSLTIEHGSEAFTALLMRSSNVSHMSFCDFISMEAERDIFRDKVSALGKEDVGSCRVTLSDSLQNPINAELLFVKVNTFNSVHYLLGIREFSDAAHMPSFKSFPDKKRMSSANKGTPPMSERASLKATGSAASKTVAKPCQLRFPLLPETEDFEISCALFETMSEWNIKVPRTTCCSFHAYTMKLRETIKVCSRLECRPHFPGDSLSDMQCQACGEIGAEGVEDGRESQLLSSNFGSPDVGSCLGQGTMSL
eukprot:TRINITY_DN11628_c0_g2_i1.p1 TRINITY_DN11628_c0_g2~~TRINITY_DN11628_c0_g2_i1.p1  ORF type:complete len:521 (+),score=69.64 TRINITY_DN11628_c0_g2_i1:91-1653(+)